MQRRRRWRPPPSHSVTPGPVTECDRRASRRWWWRTVTALLIILALAVVIGIAVTLLLVLRSAKHGLRRHPLPKLAYRWLTGLPWDGKDPVPDATWFHRGSEEANVSGRRIRSFYYRIRLARAGIRLGETAGFWLCVVVLVVWGLASPVSLGLTVAAAVVIAAGLASWTGVRWVRVRLTDVNPAEQAALYKSRAVAALPGPARWEANRELYRPMHYRAHQMAAIPPSFKPRRWIEIAPDRQTVTLTIPDGLDVAKAQPGLHQVVTQTVFCDNRPDCTPKMAGKRRQLVYTAAKPPPPPLVLLDPDESRGALGIRHLIEAAAWHELVLGYGIGGVPVIRSLDKAVPHWGLSMPQGTARASLRGADRRADAVPRGGLPDPGLQGVLPPVGAVQDAERVVCGDSGADPPDAAVADGRGHEAEARGLEFIQMDGTFSGDVGPMIFVVAEELNATIIELKAYWKSIDGSGESPAVAGAAGDAVHGPAAEDSFPADRAEADGGGAGREGLARRGRTARGS